MEPKISNPAAVPGFGDSSAQDQQQDREIARPVSFGTRMAQAVIQVPAMTLAGLRWVAWLAAFNTILSLTDAGSALPQLQQWIVNVPWWLSVLLVLVFASPLGNLPLSALIIRALTAGMTPGDYPRGGATHLRLWAAERVADTSGARNLSGATWINNYARALGAKVGDGVQLHTLPPVTGMLTLGDHCSIEQEVGLPVTGWRAMSCT